MTFLVIIIGFLMITVGVALLIMGEAPFLGKRIPALRARLIGLVLVSFLPLSLGFNKAISLLFGPDAVHGLIVTGLLFVLCWIAIGALLLPLLLAKGAKRSTLTPAVKNDMFDDPEPTPIEIIEIEEPAPKPAEKKATPTKKAPARRATKPAAEENPFDFS